MTVIDAHGSDVHDATPDEIPGTPGRGPRSSMSMRDRIATGTIGLRARRGRTLLTAIGIAIGIASMVSVLGISSSSRAALVAELDELGTNLLAVEPGQDVFGTSQQLPADAPVMIRRIGPVESAASVTQIATVVRRNEHIDPQRAGGVTVIAVEPHLLSTLKGSVVVGRFIDESTRRLPVVVLGSVAAERLGITSLEGGPRVVINDRWFDVIGLLDPIPLNPDLDRSVMIGYPAAVDQLGIDPAASRIYVRTDPDQVEAVRSVLGRTASPGASNEVNVSRPSDALEARTKVDQNLQNLLLGLGGVALLVGAVGIANVMVISVLERRTEIGVRRALGATRGHIRSQFVIESALLSALGGALGVGLGVAVTWAYARRQEWVLDVPAAALAGGVGVSLVIGAIAGLYPAAKAARLDPADAVRPT
ncbi:MAG: ABC transporter permease [Actinomycetota bacterium]